MSRPLPSLGPPLPMIQLPEPPSDTISALEWFPVTQDGRSFLGCSSWDNTVRIWDVNQAQTTTAAPQAQAKALFTLASPVLSLAWAKAGTAFSGECGGGVISMMNLQTQQKQQVGQHLAPVSGLAFSEDKNILVSSSWDQTLRFWDLRQATPVLTKQLPGKCHGIGLRNNVLCATISDKTVLVFNMNDPTGNPTVLPSPLRMTAKFISVAHDARACCIGSSEGRACIFFLGPPPGGHVKSLFPFKCCRVEVDDPTAKLKRVKVFPTNAGCFHPTEKGVVVTAGGSATFTSWNFADKVRIYDSTTLAAPVTAVNFDEGGRMFAYALGYDWHQGCHNAEAGKWPISVNVATVTPALVRSTNPANRLLA